MNKNHIQGTAKARPRADLYRPCSPTSGQRAGATCAPGGPEAQVLILPISGRAAGSDRVIEASLLDAGETATELELLRTVASGLGVVWGRDELGVWAVVPNEPRSAFVTSPEPPTEFPHALYREDDNGARFLIARYATQAQAEAKAAELARGGHKQAYFVESSNE